MTRLRAIFGGTFGIPSPDRAAVERVKAWARAALRAPPEADFAVNEIACRASPRQGLETVVLVMLPGAATRTCRIHKPLADVTEQDVDTALRT